MDEPRAFTLLEVLLAAALLALVVAVCLPLMRVQPDTPQPVLVEALTIPEDPLPQSVIHRTDADVGSEIQGEWIIIEMPHGLGLVWQERREPAP